MLIRSMTCVLAVVLIGSTAVCDDTQCPIDDITWRLGPNLPEFRKGGCATALDGKVVSVFGMRQPWGEMDTMYVYDTAADRWHRMASTLPMPTNDIRVVLLDGKLYALGGENIEPATSNTTPWLRIGSIQTENP